MSHKQLLKNRYNNDKKVIDNVPLPQATTQNREADGDEEDELSRSIKLNMALHDAGSAQFHEASDQNEAEPAADQSMSCNVSVQSCVVNLDVCPIPATSDDDVTQDQSTNSSDNELEQATPSVDDWVEPQHPPPMPYFVPIGKCIVLKGAIQKKKKKKKNQDGEDVEDDGGVPCDCTTSAERRAAGELACGYKCINRSMYWECDEDCPCGIYCTNKKFEQMKNADVYAKYAGRRGFGLFTNQDLPANAFIMEYVGEVVPWNEFCQRQAKYKQQGNLHQYFMKTKGNLVIDANKKGSISRFINHSCDPNCETQKWNVLNRERIGFFTKVPVKAGEELMFDYRFERGVMSQRCYCGTSKCRGWMGSDPTKVNKGKGDNTYTNNSEQELESSDETQDEAVSNTMKKGRKSSARRHAILEEMASTAALKEFIKHGHLRTKDDVMKCRGWMRTPSSYTNRLALIAALKKSEESVLSVFLSYGGVALIRNWLNDSADAFQPNEQQKLQLKLLHLLNHLPISNKNTITKIKHTVQQLQEGSFEYSDGSTAQDINIPKAVQECMNGLLDQVAGQDMDMDIETENETERAEAGQDGADTVTMDKIAVQAALLLNKWSSLREAFKIPKKAKDGSETQTTVWNVAKPNFDVNRRGGAVDRRRTGYDNNNNHNQFGQYYQSAYSRQPQRSMSSQQLKEQQQLHNVPLPTLAQSDTNLYRDKDRYDSHTPNNHMSVPAQPAASDSDSVQTPPTQTQAHGQGAAAQLPKRRPSRFDQPDPNMTVSLNRMPTPFELGLENHKQELVYQLHMLNSLVTQAQHEFYNLEQNQPPLNKHYKDEEAIPAVVVWNREDNAFWWIERRSQVPVYPCMKQQLDFMRAGIWDVVPLFRYYEHEGQPTVDEVVNEDKPAAHTISAYVLKNPHVLHDSNKFGVIRTLRYKEHEMQFLRTAFGLDSPPPAPAPAAAPSTPVSLDQSQSGTGTPSNMYVPPEPVAVSTPSHVPVAVPESELYDPSSPIQEVTMEDIEVPAQLSAPAQQAQENVSENQQPMYFNGEHLDKDLLPLGWSSALDSEGHTYFFTLKTRYTQWDLPLVASEHPEDLQESARLKQLRIEQLNRQQEAVSSSSQAEPVVDVNAGINTSTSKVSNTASAKKRSANSKAHSLTPSKKKRPNTTKHGSPTTQAAADTSSAVTSAQRAKFKEYVQKQLVKVIHPYYKNKQMASSDDYKHLSRKMLRAFCEKEQGHLHLLILNEKDATKMEKLKQRVLNFGEAYLKERLPPGAVYHSTGIVLPATCTTAGDTDALGVGAALLTDLGLVMH